MPVVFYMLISFSARKVTVSNVALGNVSFPSAARGSYLNTIKMLQL